jgi:hypothetical protein
MREDEGDESLAVQCNCWSKPEMGSYLLRLLR